MDYPNSNTQGRIFALTEKNDDRTFIEYIPVGFPLLNRFLFREGRRFTFTSRTGKQLGKSNLPWQIQDLKRHYFVPTKQSYYEFIEGKDPLEQVDIRVMAF